MYSTGSLNGVVLNGPRYGDQAADGALNGGNFVQEMQSAATVRFAGAWVPYVWEIAGAAVIRFIGAASFYRRIADAAGLRAMTVPADDREMLVGSDNREMLVARDLADDVSPPRGE